MTLAELDRALMAREGPAPTEDPVLERTDVGWVMSCTDPAGRRLYVLSPSAYDGDDPMIARLVMWRLQAEEADWNVGRERSRAFMREAEAARTGRVS